jgi:hypothetical protein
MKNQNGFGNFGTNPSFGSGLVSPETNTQVLLNAKTALEVLALVNRPAAMQLVAEVNFALNGYRANSNQANQYQQPQYGGMHVPMGNGRNAQSSGWDTATAMYGWDHNHEFQQVQRATGQNSFTYDTAEKPVFLDIALYGYRPDDFIECNVLLRFPSDVLVETTGIALFNGFPTVAFLVRTHRSPRMVVVGIDNLRSKDGRLVVRAQNELSGYPADEGRSVIVTLRTLGYDKAADLFEQARSLQMSNHMQPQPFAPGVWDAKEQPKPINNLEELPYSPLVSENKVSVEVLANMTPCSLTFVHNPGVFAVQLHAFYFHISTPMVTFHAHNHGDTVQSNTVITVPVAHLYTTGTDQVAYRPLAGSFRPEMAFSDKNSAFVKGLTDPLFKETPAAVRRDFEDTLEAGDWIRLPVTISIKDQRIVAFRIQWEEDTDKGMGEFLTEGNDVIPTGINNVILSLDSVPELQNFSTSLKTEYETRKNNK